MIRWKNRTTELIRSAVDLSWFFLNKKSKVVSFDISSSELFSCIDIDIVQEVSNCIELARHTDLDLIDNLARQTNFWSDEDWPAEYDHLRYVLKLGWLIKDIASHGARNPIQLLQSDNNKYIAHPGTARILVLSYILPRDKVKVFYVWDPVLDPEPFFHNQPYKEITNAFTFLSMFNKTNRFEIKATTLNDSLICEDGTEHCYFKIANDSLKRLHTNYSLDFITCLDTNHWFSDIKYKTFFKDIISFHTNKCVFGGVGFTKINDIWITDDKH
jgi:hypothetical protein